MDEQQKSYLRSGIRRGAEYVVEVKDPVNQECYPVFVMPGEDVEAVKRKHDGSHGLRVCAVYALAEYRPGGAKARLIQESEKGWPPAGKGAGVEEEILSGKIAQALRLFLARAAEEVPAKGSFTPVTVGFDNPLDSLCAGRIALEMISYTAEPHHETICDFQVRVGAVSGEGNIVRGMKFGRAAEVLGALREEGMVGEILKTIRRLARVFESDQSL